jgi:hypothetical protein
MVYTYYFTTWIAIAKNKQTNKQTNNLLSIDEKYNRRQYYFHKKKLILQRNIINWHVWTM